MSAFDKARLVLRVWRTYLDVRRRVNQEPLPELVARVGRAESHAARQPPMRLSRAVHRSLRLGSRQPTCLVSSLVLFRLLREQGEAAELVIGLPRRASDQEAHAWVELSG